MPEIHLYHLPRNLLNILLNCFFRVGAIKKEEKISFFRDIKILIVNKNYLKVVLSMTLSFAAYIAFLTNQDLLYKPYGYNSQDVSILNIVLVISGLLGSMICARYLDGERPKYKLLFNVCSVIGLVFNALFLVTIPLGLPKYVFGINLFLYGLFIIPTFSVIFPSVVELTYPCNEAVSIGLMLLCCRIGATLFGVLGTIIAEVGFFYCASFITFVTFLGVLPAFFIVEELRKINMTSFYHFFNKVSM